MNCKNNGAVFETQNQYADNLHYGRKEHVEDFDENDMILDEIRLNTVENIIYNTNNLPEGVPYNSNDSNIVRNKNFPSICHSLPQLPSYSCKRTLKNCGTSNRIVKENYENDKKFENTDCDTANLPLNESKYIDFRH